MAASPARIAVAVEANIAVGAARIAVHQVRGILDRGHPVDLLIGHAGHPRAFTFPEQARQYELPLPLFPRAIPAIAQYLRAEAPAAILAKTNPVAIPLLRAALNSGSKARIVVSLHNRPTQNQGQTPGALDRLRHQVQLLYHRADALVAVSEGIADDFAQVTGYPREKIGIIPNPAVFPELEQMAEAEVAHPFFTPGAPPVILGVGRLIPMKNFGSLVRAFARVRERRPCRLLILGEGYRRPALEGLCQTLGVAEDVALPGFDPNPYKYMRRAAVFVLSSMHEGLPNVLIEAMACGTPLVSTDCPSGPREILDGGKFGVLVPVNDPEALAEGIVQALDSPAAPDILRAAARRYALAPIIQRYLDVLLG